MNTSTAFAALLALTLGGTGAVAHANGTDKLYVSHVHRGGGTKERPDNTLETFKWCWENGSAVECDCRKTKDGVGIMLHDDRLARTARGFPKAMATNSVSRCMTWDEIKDVDVGSYLGPEFSHHRIPTIEATFAAMKGHPTYLAMVDEKGAGPDYIAKKAVEAGVQDQVYYTGPSHENIVKWNKTLPGGKSLLWIGAWPKNRTAEERARTDKYFRDKMAALRKADFRYITAVSLHSYYDPKDPVDPFLPSTAVLRECIDEFHAHGIVVCSIPFAGGEREETYFRLFELGCDGFSTDYPSVMFSVIAKLKKGERGLPSDKPYDLVVYGSSPAAIAAAIQAKRMGKRAVVVSPETRIGGLTTGGLGQTDIGNKKAFGGIALEFYKAVADYYRDEANWTRQKRSDYLPDGQCSGTKGEDSMWTFEPSAALKILEGWEKRDGLEIVRGERLDRRPGGVITRDGRIVGIRTLSGKTFAGKMFVDATYEGDLMAAAGVSYFVGREANDVYGETINGNAPDARGSKNHNFVKGVSPYVTAGDKSSGLLPGVEPYDPNAKPGDGDKRVQAYCFRMCLTDDPANRIAFKKPEGYDERDYELLFRNMAAKPKAEFDGNTTWKMPWINSKMPNRKTDTNNRDGFSTDFVGKNWAWPEASYAEREAILAAHLKYQRGLMWTLANHPSIPEPVRREVSKWGTCRDEFSDGLGDGWQRQLYVREARRMIGDFVMTEKHCRGAEQVARPIAMGAYGMDSHNVRRIETADGFVRNEGNVEDYVGIDGKRFPPFGVDYGAIVPKRGECSNLFVPVCISASHIAFGSIRMEPVFFALGQVAGTAAAQAVDADCAVQDVAYEKLRERLLADGQVLAIAK